MGHGHHVIHLLMSVAAACEWACLLSPTSLLYIAQTLSCWPYLMEKTAAVIVPGCLGGTACANHKAAHVQTTIKLEADQPGHCRYCSPVNEKKPNEHSRPARKALKGKVPTSIM